MLEGYLLQNIVIMSHLNVCCCCVFFFFLFFCNMVKINIHIYSEFVVCFKSGQYLHLLKPLAGQKNFQRPWPQCPGLNRSRTAQTSSPSLRQLPPGVIVVTMNDWQPPGCQSKCDLLRPHWFEPQNELWVFFSFQHYHHHNLEYWTHDGDERICHVINKDWKVSREKMKTNSDKCWLDVKRTALG